MSDKSWSIILPSRERPDVLNTLLDSIRSTAADPDSLEVLVAIDFDDHSISGKVEEFCSRFPFLRFVTGARQDNFSAGYYNVLARMSRGRFVQAMNDDVRFLTAHWDTLGAKAMEEYADRFPMDRIAYGKCEDGLGTGYACFPTLTREAINALGWFFHPEFRTWSADIHLHAVFAGIDRCTTLPFAVAHERRYDGVHGRMAGLQTSNMGSVPGCVWNLKRFIESGTPCWK